MELSSLVGENLAHRNPDVLGLGRLVEELFASALDSVVPVAFRAVVDPGALDVVGRGVLDEPGALGGAKVPDGLNILVLGEVLDEVIALARDDVPN